MVSRLQVLSEEVLREVYGRREAYHDGGLLRLQSRRRCDRLAETAVFRNRAYVVNNALRERLPPVSVPFFAVVYAEELAPQREPRRVPVGVVDSEARLEHEVVRLHPRENVRKTRVAVSGVHDGLAVVVEHSERASSYDLRPEGVAGIAVC